MNYQEKESTDGKGYQRNGSPAFYQLLEEMAELHDKKSHDYASNSNPFGNYHFAGQMAIMFKHSPQDAGFLGRLAEKIYRIANLESSGFTPANESVEDTERDICVITALWMASRRDARATKRELINKIKNQAAAGEWSGSLADSPEARYARTSYTENLKKP